MKDETAVQHRSNCLSQGMESNSGSTQQLAIQQIHHHLVKVKPRCSESKSNPCDMKYPNPWAYTGQDYAFTVFISSSQLVTLLNLAMLYSIPHIFLTRNCKRRTNLISRKVICTQTSLVFYYVLSYSNDFFAI